MIETRGIISPSPHQEPNTTPTLLQSLHQLIPSPTLAIAPPLPPLNRDDYSILSFYHSEIYGPNAIIQLQAVLPQLKPVTTCYRRTICAPRHYPESWIDKNINRINIQNISTIMICICYPLSMIVKINVHS